MDAKRFLEAAAELLLSVGGAALMACTRAQPPAQPSIEIGFEARPAGSELERELVFVLRDRASGSPITGAEIEVILDMPSMPMMHRTPKVFAQPGDEAGRYRARVTLEMAGEWAAQIVVKRPTRVTAVRKFSVGIPPASRN